MSLLSLPENVRRLRSEAPPEAPSGGVRRVPSRRLLGGGRELVIEHHGNEYHLRLTRNDKLILTK